MVLGAVSVSLSLSNPRKLDHACHVPTCSITTSPLPPTPGILNYAFSDYLWAHAVLLLGPTIATLGLSVQIPIAAVAEAVFGQAAWLASARTTAMTLGGTGLILFGFFWGNLAGGDQLPGAHHREDTLEGEKLQGTPNFTVDWRFVVFYAAKQRYLLGADVARSGSTVRIQAL